jgi:hypothetical protein
MSTGVGRAGLLLYLAGLFALSGASIGGLYAAFLVDFPAFLREFLADPPGAVQADPVPAGLFVLSLAAMAGLVALIVLFGATYGPEPRQ